MEPQELFGDADKRIRARLAGHIDLSADQLPVKEGWRDGPLPCDGVGRLLTGRGAPDS